MDIPLYLDEILVSLNAVRLKPMSARKSLDVDVFLVKHPELTMHEDFIGLIEILLLDKYVRCIEGKPYNSILDERKDVLITVKGSYFLLQGGYRGKIQKEQCRLRQDEEYKSNQERYASQQRAQNIATLFLTIVIAIGTTVAAIYYAIEICKDFHPPPSL